MFANQKRHKQTHPPPPRLAGRGDVSIALFKQSPSVVPIASMVDARNGCRRCSLVFRMLRATGFKQRSLSKDFSAWHTNPS
jgi:hypothetical protein